MSNRKTKILLLVEGAKTDVALMERLIQTYKIDARYEIVSYRTNIYTLYREMFEDNDPESFNLLHVLKAREPDESRKVIFDESYSDVLLIFDLDPQAPDFSPEKISRMAEYFVESSDMGKLYLNYPMVEAFYHMATIPDPKFDSYYATLDELCAGEYKARVNRENRNHDYRKFATSREESNLVILQNIDKAQRLTGSEPMDCLLPQQKKVLDTQLEYLMMAKKIAVLSTCAFFIPEYNPKLLCE